MNPYGFTPVASMNALGGPGYMMSAGGAPLPPMQLPRAVVRIGEQAIWSTQQYADAAALASRSDPVFSTPINQTGQGFGAALSLAETNIREASRIPGGFAYTVKALAVQPYYPDCFPIVRADVQNVIAHCVLVWAFLQTRIEIAPVWLIGAGGGLFGSTADTGAADGGLGGSRILINNGAGGLWIYNDHPVALPSNATFNLDLTWGTSAVAVQGGSNNSAMNLRVVMLGTFESAIPIG